MLDILSYLKMFELKKKILVAYWLSGKDDFDFEYLSTEADIEENDLQTCKSFHSNLQNLIDDNLQEMIASCLTHFRETWIEIYS